MGRTCKRASLSRLDSVGIACALLLQFAPAIHALTPHPEDKSACSHPSAALHLESTEGERHSPCALCVQLFRSQSLPLAAGCSLGLFAAEVPAPIFSPARPEASVLPLPDSRGPPPGA